MKQSPVSLPVTSTDGSDGNGNYGSHFLMIFVFLPIAAYDKTFRKLSDSHLLELLQSKLQCGIQILTNTSGRKINRSRIY